MATGTSDLIVRLSLDTTQFESSLSKFVGQMTEPQASYSNVATGVFCDGQVHDGDVFSRKLPKMRQQNDHMNGEFPVLRPDANAICRTGTATKVDVGPNWRHL